MTTELSDRVGANVRTLRQRLKWSAEDLAARAGLTTHMVYVIESGRRENGRRRRMVTVDEHYALAKALDVHPEALLTDTLVIDDDPRRLLRRFNED